MITNENFSKYGALLIKNVIPIELCYFLTHTMLRQHHENQIKKLPSGDGQVNDSLACVSHNLVLDTVAERIWPFLENILNEELIPTYSYARLYTNDNVLDKHTDRPACEISITIQLGRSHHYSWPIFANNQRFDLAEGSGMLYKGCEVEHWREPCAGPDDYYSGQLFCHFVRANGQYVQHAGDQRWLSEMPFVKYRTVNMETK